MTWDLDNIRPDKEISRNEMRKIFESPELLPVQLVARFLEHEGIHVSLVNEHQAGNPGIPHWAKPVNAELWFVNLAQYDRAIVALAQYRENQGREVAEAISAPSKPVAAFQKRPPPLLLRPPTHLSLCGLWWSAPSQAHHWPKPAHRGPAMTAARPRAN